MEIVLDIDDPIPSLARLVRQIKRAVTRGALRPGDPLPSVRQLANDLEIDRGTVARAYRLLELDAVIRTNTRHGASVHPNARVNSERVGWSWFPPPSTTNPYRVTTGWEKLPDGARSAS